MFHFIQIHLIKTVINPNLLLCKNSQHISINRVKQNFKVKAATNQVSSQNIIKIFNPVQAKLLLKIIQIVSQKFHLKDHHRIKKHSNSTMWRYKSSLNINITKIQINFRESQAISRLLNNHQNSHTNLILNIVPFIQEKLPWNEQKKKKNDYWYLLTFDNLFFLKRLFINLALIFYFGL